MGKVTKLSHIRPRRHGLATTVSFLVALLTWALASPSASAPDDDLHIANIYCIHDSTTCRSDDWEWPWGSLSWAADPADRTGPEYRGAREAYPDLWAYAQPRALPCYVTNGDSWYNPDAAVPADCLADEDPKASQPASLDLLGYYPDLYYRFMSLFTGDTLRVSVIHWRVLNVLLAVCLVSLSLVLSAGRYRRPLAVAGLAASMPLGLFLISSVNPTAWLVIGTAAFLGPAVTVLRERSSPGLLAARIALLLVCLLMMVAGRSEGASHAAVLVVVAVLLGLKAPRVVYGLLGSLVILVGLVALVAIGHREATKAGAALDGLQTGLGAGGLWHALVSVPGFFFGTDATRLGWLEVIPPPAAVIATNAAFWGAFFLGLAVMFWRKTAALAFVAGVLLVIPAAMVAGGSQVPPTRYFLPLVYMLAFVVLVPAWGRYLPRWSNAQWIALGAALTTANTLSLLYLTVRYVSGIQSGTTDPMSLARTPTPDWWWGSWLNPFANWLLGSLAFAIGVGLLFTLPSVRVGAPQAEPEPGITDPNHDSWHPTERQHDRFSAGR